jgi:signal transduction histidine kinase
MHGELTVQSAPGWGSTFTLRLPLAQPEPAAVAAVAAAPGAP